MFLIKLIVLILMFVNVPESLALLIFGVSLTGATAALRWFLNRSEQDQAAKDKKKN
jgi:hypothetical protein